MSPASARSSLTPVSRLCAELLEAAGLDAGTLPSTDAEARNKPSVALLDDGVCILMADGALWRRCAVSAETPRGRDCVGMYFFDGQGWSARIAKCYDAATRSDYQTVAVHAERLEAIATLWHARARAGVKRG